MPSILETDGYKFSMAEAGFPLRDETFYYSHRKGGWQFLPIDVEDFIRKNLPTASPEDYTYLDSHGYFQGGAFRQAITLHDRVRVTSLPKGAWFYDREPVFSVHGPSALVSWLEPVVLQINFRIQVATCALLSPEKLGEMVEHATCEREREIIGKTLDTVGVVMPKMHICSEDYSAAVLTRAKGLVDISGDANRLLEVGMRAVTCHEQHEIALRSVKEAGITRTFNGAIPRTFDMIPVGTMRLEHVPRHGSDYAAYTSMRDKFPGFIFYLPDTFDTLASGIPSALAAMQEDPSRNSGIRFDSEHGIVGHYLYAVNRARECNLTPLLGLESGWDDKKTTQFEDLRRLVGWPADRQGYGYGGFLVKPPWKHFGRDDVSAVWKITRSGDKNTMKFGDEPKSGKASIPGRPVIWRPHLGMAAYQGPVGWVAQEGEDWTPPVPATLLSGARGFHPAVNFQVGEVKGFALTRTGGVAMSPATQALIDRCTAERAAGITSMLTNRKV